MSMYSANQFTLKSCLSAAEYWGWENALFSEFASNQVYLYLFTLTVAANFSLLKT